MFEELFSLRVWTRYQPARLDLLFCQNLDASYKPEYPILVHFRKITSSGCIHKCDLANVAQAVADGGLCGNAACSIGGRVHDSQTKN